MRSVLVTLAILTLPFPVLAQAAGPARNAAVLRSCRDEAARRCPGPDATSGRNLAICLRPYRSSLSLACRHAVTAATP